MRPAERVSTTDDIATIDDVITTEDVSTTADVATTDDVVTVPENAPPGAGDATGTLGRDTVGVTPSGDLDESSASGDISAGAPPGTEDADPGRE